MHQVINSICSKGSVSDLQALLATHVDKSDLKLSLHCNFDEAFQTACISGKKDIVIYLLSIEEEWGQFDIHGEDDRGFNWACRRGHTELISYLIDIGIRRSVPFDLRKHLISAVMCGSKPFLTDLVSQIDLTDSTMPDLAYRMVRIALLNNMIDTTLFILSLPIDLDLNKNFDDLFVSTCLMGHLESLRILIDYGLSVSKPINLHAQGNKAFKKSDKTIVSYLRTLEKN